MNSYSLYFLKNEQELFLMFWKKFEKEINNFKNIFIKNNEDNIVITFQIIQKNKLDALNNIKVWLADCVVVYYKFKYLKENLIVPKLNAVSNDAVCKALAIYDKITDVEYALDSLEFQNELNVNSYYIFKLGELRIRWEEICKLFYYNLPELVASDAFLELLKYLLSITEPTIKSVYISCCENEIYIKDEDGFILVEPVKLYQDYVTKIILSVISLAPKNIYIKEGNKLKDVGKSLVQLFNNKVVYCT